MSAGIVLLCCLPAAANRENVSTKNKWTTKIQIKKAAAGAVEFEQALNATNAADVEAAATTTTAEQALLSSAQPMTPSPNKPHCA